MQLDPMAISRGSSVRDASATARPDAAASAARRFEALAIERMLEPATRPLFARGLLDGGSAGALGRQLFVAELARIAAERGGLGLADSMAPSPGAGGTR